MTAATLRRENKQQQPLLTKFAHKFGTLSDPDSVMKTLKLEVPPVSSQNSDGDHGATSFNRSLRSTKIKELMQSEKFIGNLTVKILITLNFFFFNIKAMKTNGFIHAF